LADVQLVYKNLLWRGMEKEVVENVVMLRVICWFYLRRNMAREGW
jgi:hypothetical protein